MSLVAYPVEDYFARNSCVIRLGRVEVVSVEVLSGCVNLKSVLPEPHQVRGKRQKRARDDVLRQLRMNLQRQQLVLYK